MGDGERECPPMGAVPFFSESPCAACLIGRVDAASLPRQGGVRPIKNHGPIMVHELVPTATFYAYGRHPRRVFAISYSLTGFFTAVSLRSGKYVANKSL